MGTSFSLSVFYFPFHFCNPFVGEKERRRESERKTDSIFLLDSHSCLNLCSRNVLMSEKKVVTLKAALGEGRTLSKTIFPLFPPIFPPSLFSLSNCV